MPNINIFMDIIKVFIQITAPLITKNVTGELSLWSSFSCHIFQSVFTDFNIQFSSSIASIEYLIIRILLQP